MASTEIGRMDRERRPSATVAHPQPRSPMDRDRESQRLIPASPRHLDVGEPHQNQLPKRCPAFLLFISFLSFLSFSPSSIPCSLLSLFLSLFVRTGGTQPPQPSLVKPSVEMDGGAEETVRSPASATTTDWRRLWSSGEREPSRGAHSEELGRAEERRI